MARFSQVTVAVAAHSTELACMDNKVNVGCDYGGRKNQSLEENHILEEVEARILFQGVRPSRPNPIVTRPESSRIIKFMKIQNALKSIQ